MNYGLFFASIDNFDLILYEASFCDFIPDEGVRDRNFSGPYYYLGNSDIIFPKSMYLRVMSISRTINLKSIYVYIIKMKTKGLSLVLYLDHIKLPRASVNDQSPRAWLY